MNLKMDRRRGETAKWRKRKIGRMNKRSDASSLSVAKMGDWHREVVVYVCVGVNNRTDGWWDGEEDDVEDSGSSRRRTV